MNRSSNALLVLAAGAVSMALSGCGGSDEPRSTPTPTSAAESAATFRDGTYVAEGTYGNGPSFIGVTLTVTDDIVTDVEVATRATDPTSLDLQERFAEAVPDVVVGRPLDGLEVDKLAGSSGTPVGFNDALDQIRDQAQD